MMRKWIAPLGLVLFSSPAVADVAGCDAKPISSLPMTMLSGKPLVIVEINGQPSFFAIDTGGWASTITQRLVDRLKIPTRAIPPNVKIRDVGGENASKYARVSSIGLGGLRGGPEVFVVAELSPGIDGFIAPDYLQNFSLDIDFPGNALRLYKPGDCAQRPPGNAEFSTVSMEVSRQGHISIPVYLDGKQIRAEIDTGASGSLLTESAARSAFGIKMGEQRSLVRGAAGGTLEAERHDFKNIAIGSIYLQEPSINIVNRTSGFDSAPILLGISQIQELRLFVAYREHTLYVSRPTSAKPVLTVAEANIVSVAGPVLNAEDAIARAVDGKKEQGRFSFVVRSTGVSDGTIYLDSETNYRDAKNIAVDVPIALWPEMRVRFGESFRTALTGKTIVISGIPERVAVRTRDSNGKEGMYYQTHIPIDRIERLVVSQ